MRQRTYDYESLVWNGARVVGLVDGWRKPKCIGTFDPTNVADLILLPATVCTN